LQDLVNLHGASKDEMGDERILPFGQKRRDFSLAPKKGAREKLKASPVLSGQSWGKEKKRRNRPEEEKAFRLKQSVRKQRLGNDCVNKRGKNYTETMP